MEEESNKGIETEERKNTYRDDGQIRVGKKETDRHGGRIRKEDIEMRGLGWGRKEERG